MNADNPTAWHDLFIGLLGGGASLAGLSFVAIALNPLKIASTPLLRARAWSSVGSFAGVVLIGVTALTPAPYVRISGVVLALSAIGGALGILRRLNKLRSPVRSGPFVRGVGGLLAATLEVVGGLALAVTQRGWAYYLLVVACAILITIAINSSWLLVLQIDVSDDDSSLAHAERTLHKATRPRRP